MVPRYHPGALPLTYSADMHQRDVRRRGSTVLASAAEWLPVPLVLVLAQMPSGLEQPWTGSRVSLAVSGLALALPLLWRVSRPVTTCAAVGAAVVLQDLLGDALGFGAFVATLVAVYSAGRWADGPRRLALALALLGAGVAVATASSVPEDPGGVLVPLFYYGAATVLGRMVTHHAAQAAELRRLNEVIAAEQDTRTRLAVVDERVRLARELHDGVAHTVTVMVIQAEAARATLETGGQDVGPTLERIVASGQHGLEDLRGLVRVLRGPLDGPDHRTPTLEDLPNLVAVLADAGLVVRVDGEAGPGLDDELTRDLFRVCQEALTNVLRHSSATTATVCLDRVGTDLLVEVHDPGPPREGVGAPTRGHGVQGMHERMTPYGSAVEAGPDEDGHGYRVRVRVRVAVTVPPATVAARPA